MRGTAELVKLQDNAVGEVQPRRILFVCTGNTCRSPMAAALLNHLASGRREELVATSAGLYAREGELITAAAAEALAEAGVSPTPQNDYRAHRARLVSAALLKEADEVIAITGGHAMELMMRFPEYAARIGTLEVDIPDPFGGDGEVYRRCLEMLTLAIRRKWFPEESGDEGN